MNVFIARDGAEIGEYPREQLEELARIGGLRRSDFYWYEGMETWLRLGDLLGEDAWRPKPRRVVQLAEPEPVEVAPAPALPIGARLRSEIESFRARLPGMRQRFYWLGGLLLGFILLAALVIHLINSAHSERPAVPAVLDFAKPAESPPADPNALRDQASADLRRRIERLPSSPLPPRYTFYYGVQVSMRKTYESDVPWVAVMRGGENTINPETQTTLMHTDFILTAEYSKDEWRFKHYRASVSDLVKTITTEIDVGEEAAAPPSIVGEMGLKMKSQ